MTVMALLWSVMLSVPSLTGLAQPTTTEVLTGPITNPANGHHYYLLSPNSHTASEAKARTLGGHLVTINNAAENQWVFNTFSYFGQIHRCLWIGLRDVSQAGNWCWESGEAVTYLNWAFGGPNFIGEELYVYMYPASYPAVAAQWNNYYNATNAEGPLNGVVEVEPPRAATASAVVTNGFVIAATITDGGYGYTNTPTVRIVGGGGSGAQAVAVVGNGVVTSITVINAGSGYTHTPLVVINPPFIPNPVLSIAPMSLLSFSDLTVGGVYQLQQSVAWYWSNLPVSFTATTPLFTNMVAGVAGSGDYRLALNPVPAQAFATAVVSYGFVVHATVTSGGSGYVTSPAVTFLGGGGTNATAVAHISDGVVTSITITHAGIDYTNTPTIRIEPPPAAAVSSTVSPVMRLDCANLVPYENYQIQFKPDFSATWGNWNGGLFSPTSVTNSQYLFITDGLGLFRLQYVP